MTKPLCDSGEELRCVSFLFRHSEDRADIPGGPAQLLHRVLAKRRLSPEHRTELWVHRTTASPSLETRDSSREAEDNTPIPAATSAESKTANEHFLLLIFQLGEYMMIV